MARPRELNCSRAVVCMRSAEEYDLCSVTGARLAVELSYFSIFTCHLLISAYGVAMFTLHHEWTGRERIGQVEIVDGAGEVEFIHVIRTVRL